MKVLFVSSGNNANGISPIVKNQGDSLKNSGCEINYFTIKGKGFKGYLANIPRLRKVIKNYSPDIVHAHYSLCGFVASFASNKPTVVSLMGSDVKSNSFYRRIIRFFIRHRWDNTIVKSDDMKKDIGVENIHVIPNGVDFNVFKPLRKRDCQEKIGWDTSKRHILFPANPEREVKNYPLAKSAIANLNNSNIETHFLVDVPNSDVHLYYNAADVVLLTSLWEGSPNVIKEAMACDRYIVSTDVGDVRELLSDVEGGFVTGFDNALISQKLQIAFEKQGKSNGRDVLGKMGLNSQRIAQNIIEIYKSVI